MAVFSQVFSGFPVPVREVWNDLWGGISESWMGLFDTFLSLPTLSQTKILISFYCLVAVFEDLWNCKHPLFLTMIVPPRCIGGEKTAVSHCPAVWDEHFLLMIKVFHCLLQLRYIPEFNLSTVSTTTASLISSLIWDHITPVTGWELLVIWSHILLIIPASIFSLISLSIV